jgi:hypothetical protein
LQGKANIDVKLDPVWRSNADVEQQNGRVTVRSVWSSNFSVIDVLWGNVKVTNCMEQSLS